MAFDVQAVREQFPALKRLIRGKQLVYLDSGASAHKPQVVLDAISELYREHYANVHRGVHTLSQEATDRYEASRLSVARFLGCKSEEVVFTRGTTEALNLVAFSFGELAIGAGDAIVVTEIEHHSNLVPWQLLCERTGATLRVVRVDDEGTLDLADLTAKLKGAKLLSIGHVSNALGTIHPVKEITELAHKFGAKVCIDGAQGAVHLPVNVHEIGCDFYAFSAHKVYGPTGIGALYIREKLLNELPPWHGGGEMIKTVDLVNGSTWATGPARFEAGTPNIVGAVGMGVACDWLNDLGREQVSAFEQTLLQYGRQQLQEVDGLRLIGTSPQSASILSFVLEGVHSHDLGTLLDQQGIAVRTGHHCAQPAMRRFSIQATTRASLAVYSTTDEIDLLVAGVQKAARMLR